LGPEVVHLFNLLVAKGALDALGALSAPSGASGSLTLSCDLKGDHHVKCL
jgi:hypothetical protein